MSHVANDDSEDDFDWEEVEVPELSDVLQQPQEQHIEITIQTAPGKKKEAAKQKGISQAERIARINCHKIHTIALLANAFIRNKWINDELLHARLISLTPLSLQNAFSVIHKSRVPDQNQRGRMFEAAVNNLVEWWYTTYFEVTLEGHIRNRTYESVQTKLNALNLPDSPDTLLDMETVKDFLDEDGELIRGPNSLMKHALMRQGCRDTSAQLFTALCRALSIPARLVVSLQSVPWQVGLGKPRPTHTRKGKDKKGKGKAEGAHDEEAVDVEEDMNEGGSVTSTATPDPKGKGKAQVSTSSNEHLEVPPRSAKAKGKERATTPAPHPRLRQSNTKLQALSGPSSASASSSRFPSPAPVDPTISPPVFWTEVFSRPDARWLPVDPIRGIVNKRKIFDPTPAATAPGPQSSGLSSLPYSFSVPGGSRRGTPSPGTPVPAGRAVQRENRMLYVLAFEEDGYARDVTRRYARDYSTRVAKAQGGSSAAGTGGKGRLVWWEAVLSTVYRPYRLHRDDLEDEELELAQLMEGMPTTMAGFKDHPMYVLSRHLRQTEVIHPAPPTTPELGKFRGEPVYPRSAVVSLKTAENWMRSEGRTVREGEQPLKMVKVRAGTLNRLRELEVLKEAGSSSSGTGNSGSMDGGTAPSGSGNAPGEIMQGLYVRDQTEVYQPAPVVDGKVPKNNFGNIDLYVPSMLPQGAVHVPYKGTAKIARRLNIDFAEAVTGFEFRKRRAFPIIEGVVVAVENEAILLEAYLESEKEAAQKAEVKRHDRVIKLWTKVIQGLRIRQRLQEQYALGNRRKGAVDEEGTEPKEEAILGMSAANASGSGVVGGGGFVTAADDVVMPYHLPRGGYRLAVNDDDEVDERLVGVEAQGGKEKQGEEEGEGERVEYAMHTMDVDEEEEMVVVLPVVNGEGPRTMRQLAMDAEERREKAGGSETVEVEVEVEVEVLGKVEEVGGGVGVRGGGRRKKGVSSGRGRERKRGRGRSTNATRKRKRDDDDDDDEEEEEERQDSGSSDDEDGAPLPPPPKKTRGRRSTTTTTVEPPSGAAATSGGRILRPRKPKTAAQLSEEQAQEDAYRRATTS